MEGTSVTDIRKRLGLSQERFARLVDVSVQTVRRWESGLTRPLPIISLRLRELEQQAQAQPQVQPKRGGAAMAQETRRRDEGVTADIGLGLGGLFKGMGSLLEVLAKMSEDGKEEASRTGTVEAMGGRVKGVYGFTVRLGLGGKPVVEQFGNIRETPSGAAVTETREPLVDVLDEGGYIRVIAEMPGVEEGDVRVKVEGDILEISASRGARQYHKEVLLPTAASPQNVATSYRNGILDVRLAKAQSGQE
jgi:HSP20 family protein